MEKVNSPNVTSMSVIVYSCDPLRVASRSLKEHISIIRNAEAMAYLTDVVGFVTLMLV